jgi:hypothetical protein
MHQKDDVHYTDNAKGRDHCSICKHFERMHVDRLDRCAIVVGPIKAMGWCTEFKSRLEGAKL